MKISEQVHKLLLTGLALAPAVVSGPTEKTKGRKLRWFDDGSNGRTRCRKKGLIPHQQGLWQEGFPNSEEPVALCEGTVTMEDDDSICTEGRVTYDQIAEVAAENDRYIRAPAATDISVPGHLISGSSNLVLGSEAFLLYDFISSYTIGGVTFAADATMTDNLLAASRGTVDAVCFTPDFVQRESYYKIKHDFWLPRSASIDFSRAEDANILYFGFFSAVAEYHTEVDAPVVSGHAQLFLISFVASIVPAFVFNVIPFLGFTGIFRLFTTGTMSTAKFPQPLDAPPVLVEDVQINTEWTTLIKAAEDGLFTDGDDKVPLYFGVLIKRIQPSPTNACWNVETAAIDIQAPQGWGDKLDDFVKNQVLPGKKISTFEPKVLGPCFTTSCGLTFSILFMQPFKNMVLLICTWENAWTKDLMF